MCVIESLVCRSPPPPVVAAAALLSLLSNREERLGVPAGFAATDAKRIKS